MKKTIKDKLDFIHQFANSPKSIGSITPSSKHLCKRMLSYINFKKPNLNIIEYGPGVGPFTNHIVDKLKEGDNLILVEQNEEFVNILRNKFGNYKGVSIYHDSALNIMDILQKQNILQVDYIVSGIPFSSIPKKITEGILDKTRDIMGETRLFIIFQYSLFKLKTLRNHFNVLDKSFVLRNFPSAYVLCMQKN